MTRIACLLALSLAACSPSAADSCAVAAPQGDAPGCEFADVHGCFATCAPPADDRNYVAMPSCGGAIEVEYRNDQLGRITSCGWNTFNNPSVVCGGPVPSCPDGSTPVCEIVRRETYCEYAQAGNDPGKAICERALAEANLLNSLCFIDVSTGAARVVASPGI